MKYMKGRVWIVETWNPSFEEYVPTGNVYPTEVEADAVRGRLDRQFPRKFKRRVAQYMRLAKQEK